MSRDTLNITKTIAPPAGGVKGSYDEAEDPISVPVTSSLIYAIKAMTATWDNGKGERIDALIEQLNNVQLYLSELVNQRGTQKNEMSTNALSMNAGAVRVLDTDLPKLEDISRTINAAFSVLYEKKQVVPEIAMVQRAIELGGKVRDVEAISYFDTGRSKQISARISNETAEIEVLRAIINTIKGLLVKDKNGELNFV